MPIYRFFEICTLIAEAFSSSPLILGFSPRQRLKKIQNNGNRTWMSGQKEFQCTRSTFQVVYYSVKVSDISGVWCKALHYTTLNILNSFDIAEVYN